MINCTTHCYNNKHLISCYNYLVKFFVVTLFCFQCTGFGFLVIYNCLASERIFTSVKEQLMSQVNLVQYLKTFSRKQISSTVKNTVFIQIRKSCFMKEPKSFSIDKHALRRFDPKYNGFPPTLLPKSLQESCVMQDCNDA